MAKGGARARSGPAPDPDSLTQADGEWTILPASGREGDVPAWPLDRQTEREADLWVREWSRPQAIMWEHAGQQLEVALFVRSLVDAESAEASVAARTLVRQQMEALGISVPGMLRNRWRIDAQQSEPVSAGVRPSARDRLRVVGGDS